MMQTGERINFSTVKKVIDYPDFLDVQLESFKEFFQLDTTSESRANEGLYKVFQENFPITDTRNIFVLEFLDYFVDTPRYSIDECNEPYRSKELCSIHLKRIERNRTL